MLTLYYYRDTRLTLKGLIGAALDVYRQLPSGGDNVPAEDVRSALSGRYRPETIDIAVSALVRLGAMGCCARIEKGEEGFYHICEGCPYTAHDVSEACLANEWACPCYDPDSDYVPVHAHDGGASSLT
ncbi:hypothetical protein NKDENANG_02335 [Candidatus Entotheonellaceae bacterium PAL068K]